MSDSIKPCDLAFLQLLPLIRAENPAHEEILRIAFAAASSAEERQQLLRYYVRRCSKPGRRHRRKRTPEGEEGEGEVEAPPGTKRRRRAAGAEDGAAVVDEAALRRRLGEAAEAAEPGWWCLTTAVLHRVEAVRQQPEAWPVCLALGRDFYHRRVAHGGGGGSSELRRVPLWAPPEGPAAVHCRLPTWGRAAEALVQALTQWSLTRLAEDGDGLAAASVSAPPEYPILATSGPVHDPVRQAELDDISRDDVERGVRLLWEGLGWPRPRAGWTGFLQGQNPSPSAALRMTPAAQLVARIRDPRRVDDWTALCHAHPEGLSLRQMTLTLSWVDPTAVARAVRLLLEVLPREDTQGLVRPDPSGCALQYAPVFAWHIRRLCCVQGVLRALAEGARILDDVDAELDALRRRRQTGETVFLVGRGRY